MATSDNNSDSDCKLHCKEVKENNEVILKCGRPNLALVPGGLETTITTTVIVTSTTINTFCSSNPSILLEFASNITIPQLNLVRITFKVFKVCKGQTHPIQVGSQWVFSNTTNVSTSSTTFSFHTCDCCNCPDECCTYYVEATGTTLIINPGIVNVKINNATLSAIIVK